MEWKWGRNEINLLEQKMNNLFNNLRIETSIDVVIFLPFAYIFQITFSCSNRQHVNWIPLFNVFTPWHIYWAQNWDV